MSKENDKVNVLYNEIREILKMELSDERGERIVELVRELASNYKNAASNSKDTEFMNVANFAGFNLITLMYGASKDDEDPNNMLSFIIQVIGICTSAMVSKEEADGEK